jgi:AmmeMemoRadiSam system protein A
MGTKLKEEQGLALVKLARKTIEEKLGVSCSLSPSCENVLKDDALGTKCGTFVTLTIEGQLRGCIGCLDSRDPVVEGVKHNAANAAFHDPRFRPLSRKELDNIRVEVSILTEPEACEYSCSEDLLSKLRPGVDGVIIRCGYASATFLPQVWEQLPDKVEFLTHLCMKAGLPADAWQKNKLEVQLYQVQCFEEEEQRG